MSVPDDFATGDAIAAHWGLPVHRSKPSIFGRERALTDRVTKEAFDALHLRYPAGNLQNLARGTSFEVLLEDNRVVRVTVEFDRVEPSHPDPADPAHIAPSEIVYEGGDEHA